MPIAIELCRQIVEEVELETCFRFLRHMGTPQSAERIAAAASSSSFRGTGTCWALTSVMSWPTAALLEACESQGACWWDMQRLSGHLSGICTRPRKLPPCPVGGFELASYSACRCAGSNRTFFANVDVFSLVVRNLNWHATRTYRELAMCI